MSTNGEEEDDDEDDDDTKVNSEAESGSGGSSGDGDKDEGEEESTTTFETKKAEARLRAHFSGPLLAGQIANLASSAVRDSELVVAVILPFMRALAKLCALSLCFALSHARNRFYFSSFYAILSFNCS